MLNYLLFPLRMVWSVVTAVLKIAVVAASIALVVLMVLMTFGSLALAIFYIIRFEFELAAFMAVVFYGCGMGLKLTGHMLDWIVDIVFDGSDYF